MAAITPGIVYLLRFDRPISERHTTQHYIGWTENLPLRILSHRSHPDARLLQVAKERGIGFEIARAWRGTPADERYLKNLKSGPKLARGVKVRRLEGQELSSRQIEQLASMPF